MPSVTVGEELRSLFRAHSSGEITTREFETWKKELLDWSKCHLNQTLPAEYHRITGRR